MLKLLTEATIRIVKNKIAINAPGFLLNLASVMRIKNHLWIVIDDFSREHTNLNISYALKC